MSEGTSGLPGPEPFASRIATRSAQLGTRVCLGIDPRPTAHPLTSPERFDGDPAKTARAVVHYFQAVVEATADLVACYKLQSAFFEAMGIPGLIAMAQLLADVKDAGVPVILDAKRGDIGTTAAAYAQAYLGDGVFAADALTVNPYLGLDTLEPFLAAARSSGRCVFVLLKTSNPGSGDLQDLRLADGARLWERLARELDELARARANEHGFTPLGAVVGATYPQQLAAVREAMPNSLLLVPGYGSQGGGAHDVVPAFGGSGQALVSASRSLTYLGEGDDFPQLARAAAQRMRDEINSALAG